MRIVHIVAHDALNGVATSCKTLIKAQLRRGHQIMLITMPGAWLLKQQFDGPLEIVTSHLKTRVPEIRRIGELVREWKPTVVHCHGSKANKFGMVFRLAAGGPVVMTAHSRKIQLPPAFFRAVIAPSQQTADFHRRWNLVPKASLVIIPHIFERFGSDQSQSKDRLRDFGIEVNDFVVGIVGTVDNRKNQIDAVRILERLLKVHSKTRLLVVGALNRNDEIVDWHEVINDPALGDRIIWVGHQENAAALIGAFDVLLCTSKIEEGPIVVLEAMAQGVPVVSSAVGMVPWLIRDGIDGFVFEIGDVQSAATAIASLITDPGLCDKVGEQGRQRLRTMCDEQTILAQLDSVYETVARKADTWAPGSQNA